MTKNKKEEIDFEPHCIDEAANPPAFVQEKVQYNNLLSAMAESENPQAKEDLEKYNILTKEIKKLEKGIDICNSNIEIFRNFVDFILL